MPFRLMVLNTHYRAPLTFTEATIEEAQTNYAKICQTLKSLEIKLQLNGIKLEECKGDEEDAFFSELCNDLNTPNAISVLYAELKSANQLLRVREIDWPALSLSYGRLRDYLSTLGISVPQVALDEEGLDLYAKYNEAKKNKDFALSDALREKLIAKGIF